MCFENDLKGKNDARKFLNKEYNIYLRGAVYLYNIYIKSNRKLVNKYGTNRELAVANLLKEYPEIIQLNKRIV